MAISKEFPVVSMYIICGTDAKANRKLEKVFQRYPVRISYLQPADFSPPGSLALLQGASVHNAAGVCAATQFPSLIIESDEVLTLTTISENGHRAGVTHLMGIFPRLQFAIQNSEGEAFGGNADDLMDYFLQRNEALVKSDPVHAGLIGALEPLLHSVCLLMKNFVEMYGPSNSTVTNSSGDSNIIIHGPHSDLLHSLLQQENLTKLSKELASKIIPNVKIDDLLAHRGIGHMLMMHDSPVIPGSDREKCLHFVGKRVARKFFQSPDSIYRGVVSGFVTDEESAEFEDHLFEVIYDDGDREELTVLQLYGKSSL